jgi:hypothetical protein
VAEYITWGFFAAVEWIFFYERETDAVFRGENSRGIAVSGRLSSA